MILLGIFDIFKKKELLELPEPPTPPEGGSLSGDFPSIRGSEISEGVEFSSLPSFSSVEESSPDIVTLDVETSKSSQLPATPMVVNAPVQESSAPSKIKSRPVGQLYVSINDYQTIVGNVQNIQRAIQQSEDLLARAEHAKDLGERELESWKAQLEDIERKLNYADSIIAKAGEH